MELVLTKKPKNPILIEGFPGFGLVGTIATEFLLDHLDVELIGKMMLNSMPAMVAVHENKIVQPLGIFYNKKYNLVILHAVTASQGIEWEIADALITIAKKLNVKEIIPVEGVGSGTQTVEDKAFFYTSNEKKVSALKKLGLLPLKEGIILGVTGAILLKANKFPITCFFADTSTDLPDSKAAAKIIQALDKYLGLEVDYKPLEQQAEEFEDKLKNLLTQSQKAQDISEKKKMSYVG